LNRLTKEQAAIIGCYTGIMCGDYDEFYSLAERLLKRPAQTFEFAEHCLWE